MKLLIVTQVIDTEHPILGFFHRWVEEFAKHCEHVHVICLQAGKHSLPANVTVHSLGKEEKRGRFTYLIRFYTLIWQLRHEYDNVFVHMNQIYVILGAPFWRTWGKRVGLWYMHGSVSRSLKIAERLTDRIYTGSKESFRLESDKLIVTGHGIDTEVFQSVFAVKDLDIITVGRITPAKNIMQQIDILKSLHEAGVRPILTVVGSAVTSAEKSYENKVTDYAKVNDLKKSVIFTGKISQEKLPEILSRAKVFLTTAQNGSLDKAILEAMACGLPVVSMAPGAASLPLGEYLTTNTGETVIQIKKVLESGMFNNQANSDYVKENHSIGSLIPKILHTYV